MHTDEYEISIAREIDHCERIVKKIKAALAARQRQYGMRYPEASAAEVTGRLFSRIQSASAPPAATHSADD